VALAGDIIQAGAAKVYCLDLLHEPHVGWFDVKKKLGDKGERLVAIVPMTRSLACG
jgi:hypothetical protein